MPRPKKKPDNKPPSLLARTKEYRKKVQMKQAVLGWPPPQEQNNGR